MKKYLLLFLIVFISYLVPQYSLAQTSIDCFDGWQESKYSCSDEHKLCVDNCPKATGIDLSDFGQCLESCRTDEYACLDSAKAVYDACGNASQVDEPPVDCNQSCQKEHETCQSQCPLEQVVEEEYNPLVVRACENKCDDAYQAVFDKTYLDCVVVTKYHKCTYDIAKRDDCIGMFNYSCLPEIKEKCDDPIDACLKPLKDSVRACIAGCEPKGTTSSIDNTCSDTCNQNKNNCTESCQDTGAQTIDDKKATQGSVGVSSANFRELARANAEFQKAQADLEKLKQSDNSILEKNEEFLADYQSAIDQASVDIPANKEDAEELGKILTVLRTGIKDTHEVVSKGKDLSELPETLNKIKTGQLSNYSKLDIGTDAVNTFSDYHDLRDKGVEAGDAFAKASLDNFGASGLKIIPVLNVIELAATTPDLVLKTIGVDENNWVRQKVTIGVINKFAPSEVIKQTTDIMVENNWSDMGNTLVYAWGKVINAEGVVDTLIQFGMFENVVIGSVPVAIAQGVSSLAGLVILGGGKLVDFIGSIFTY